MEISMERQHWVLPDGIHEVFFKTLYFSASRDILEIDSLRIVDHTGIRSKLNFFTEKLRLKSSGLIPSSDENGIYMDSVLVVNPVLELGELKDSKKKVDINKDSVRSFFDQLLIRYLDIREGQIELSRPRSAPISTQRSNIKVFNLKLRPNDQRKITSSSIDLDLHDIEFYSRDSLFKLNVGHCGFSGQHLNFTNVSYGPSEKNNNFHGLVFHALGLQLKDIDADQLMNKKIHASDAVIIRPDITFFRKSKAQRDSSSALRKEHHNALMENLQNILNVPIIHLQDGRLSVQNPKRQQESIEAQHVYLTIMLNQLTKSENRQEIKSSITHFSSERIKMVLPKFRLLANNFVFSGANEGSNIRRLQLIMKPGNSLTVQNIYWEKLNWDELLNNNRIDLASIRVQQARLKMVKKPQTNQTQEKKKLLLNIGSAVIESLSLESETDSSGFLTMQGKNISTQSLSNESGHMTWKNLEEIYRISIRREGIVK